MYTIEVDDQKITLPVALEMAQKVYEGGDIHKAGYIYHKILEVQPRNASMMYALGTVLYQIKDADNAIGFLGKACALDPTDPEFQVNLGKALELKSMYDKALVCYNHCLKVKPDFNKGLLARALVLRKLDRKDEAIEAMEALLEVVPEERAQINYLLAAMRGEDVKAADPEYVSKVFDNYAHRFEEHLVRYLKYVAPSVLCDRLAQMANPQPQSWRIMDIGCGTGLCGPLLKPWSKWLSGVDLSEKMVEEARKKEIYDDLQATDMVEALRSVDEPLDLVIAADVFVYVGDLEDVFAATSANLAANGYFVFSAEYLEEGTYKVTDTGRFEHNPDYIRELSEKYGFGEVIVEEAELRYESGKPVESTVYFLKKTGEGHVTNQ